MDMEPAQFLPLKPDEFAILLALADGELHGYAILKVLERQEVRLAASLLYRKLKRMLEDGLVEESGDRRVPGDDDVRRRYYRLTGLGRAVTRAEASRIVELARSRRVRRLAGGRHA